MRKRKWVIGGSSVVSRRQPLGAGFGALMAALVLALSPGASGLAQEPDGEMLTNDIVAAEVLARISEMVQSAQAEGAFPSDELAGTNGLQQNKVTGPGGTGIDKTSRFNGSVRSESSNRFQTPNRSQNDDRRSRSRRSFRSRPGNSSHSSSASSSARGADRGSATTLPEGGGPTHLDYAAFRVIVDRNIFDPNRFPHRGGSTVRQAPHQVDSVTLVGTMSYEKGTFAFFDGTSSEYQKALKLSDRIVGYKVTNIMPDEVTLSAGTNELEMRVGMQLRREENGPWVLASRSGLSSATPASASTNAVATSAPTATDPAPSVAESEIIKKLMQRRAQE